MASITENKNGTFKFRVLCKNEPTGKYISKSMTYKPSSPNLSYGQLTKEVEAAAEKFEEQVRESSEHALENISFKAFSDKYLKIKKNSLSPSTYAFYEKVIREQLIPMFGTMKLREIRTYHVQKYITFLSTEKDREDGKKGHIGGATVKRYTSVFRSMLTLAYRMEYIDCDVGVSRRLEFPKENHVEVEVFTQEEVNEILKALEDEPIRLRAIIETALFTGCRRGEIVGLKWSDIDLLNRKVTVRRSIYKPHGEKAMEKAPKSRSSYRTISIPEHLCRILVEYKKWQDRHILLMEDEWQNLGYVFTEEDGHVMNPHTPTKQFDKFLKRHSFRHLKFHGLRHTSATLLLSQGCDIKTVSARLGHADIETTNIYVHALEEMDRGAADTFDIFYRNRGENQ